MQETYNQGKTIFFCKILSMYTINNLSAALETFMVNFTQV